MITGGKEYDRSSLTNLLKIDAGDKDVSEQTFDFIRDYFEDCIKEIGFNETD